MEHDAFCFNFERMMQGPTQQYTPVFVRSYSSVLCICFYFNFERTTIRFPDPTRGKDLEEGFVAWAAQDTAQAKRRERGRS